MHRLILPTQASPKEKLQLGMLEFIFRFRNFLLRMLAFVLYRKVTAPARILIFRTGSLGDSICAIPTITAIKKKYPDAKLDILINPGSARATLVSIEQLLDPSLYNQAINYFGLGAKQIISLLRGNKYDLVVQLPQGDAPFLSLLRDMLFYRTVASSGWGWEMGKIFMYKKLQEKWIKYDREVVRLARIAERNGVPVDVTVFPLNIQPPDTEAVYTVFREQGISAKPVIGMSIGSKRPQNRWPLRNFKEIVAHFAGTYSIVIIGGAEDKEPASQLCIHPDVYNLCGAFTPMQSAAAFKRCVLVVSNDTGPMHLSYAVGTPTVALFSSRDFRGAWYPPENGRNLVFRSEGIACALCLSDACADNVCMQHIRPPQVIAGMKTLLTQTTQSIPRATP